MKRTSAVVGIAILAYLGSAGAAAADDLYPPPPEPTLEVEASSVCVGDVPYLSWSASHSSDAAASELDGSLTITFVNPSGADHVISGQPLSGQMLWPGAAADSNGNGTDWPGWRLENGEWVEGDEWDWVVPTAQVRFTASPSVELAVDYPLPSAICAGPPSTPPPAGPEPDEDEKDDGLPDILGLTGSQTTGALAAVAGLLGVGGLLLAVRRRTQH